MVSDARQQLVENYPYFCRVVKKVASGFSEHLRAEAESEALVAMVDAADEFVQNGMTFRDFVSRRIHERMIDEARRTGKLTRGVDVISRNAHSLDEVAHADPLGNNPETHLDRLVSLDSSPHQQVEALERLQELAELPLRWQIAMVSDTREAMDELGVSEPRIMTLRKMARDHLLPDRDPLVVISLPAPSERELEMLHLIAAGDSNADVGIHMRIGTETVKTYLKHVMAKLQARNRAHAVHIAWQQGWWEQEG